jgi:hypothetical protein
VNLDQQQRLGAEIAAQVEVLATSVTDIQLERDPGLRERFGEAGVSKSYSDALHTMSFLAEAVSLGSPETFASYVGWLDGVLSSAHVPLEVLPHHLALLKQVAGELLSPAAAAEAGKAIDRGAEFLTRRRGAK